MDHGTTATEGEFAPCSHRTEAAINRNRWKSGRAVAQNVGMCGRYLFTESREVIAEAFELSNVPDLRPRYNIAPSQLVAVIGLKPDGKTRGLVPVRWGFVPRWANNPNQGPRPINARAETAATIAPFKDSFRERRCLIPASGFFEWKTEGKKKLPHLFRAKGGGPLAFAGLWDVWGEAPHLIHTCAILTVPANDVVKPFHDRMPANLTRDQFTPWLDPTANVNALQALLVPFPVEGLEVAPVSTAVNSAKLDSPDCIQPAA